MRIKNKVVCITGAAGFIGSHLADEIVERSPEHLLLVDNLFLGRMKNILHLIDEGSASFHYCDITEKDKIEQIIRTNSVDIVFNLAVIPLPTSLVRPSWTVDQNITMTTVMCELLYEGAYETLIQCSSSEAYGTSVYEPMDESHPLNPTTPYAASKAGSDLVVVSYWRTFGLDVTIPRPFNCYGPRQNDRRYAGLIPTTINRVARGVHPVIFGQGTQRRDYLYVQDTVRGIADCYERIATRGKVINIASGKNISVKEIVEIILDKMGSTLEVDYMPPRSGDVENHLGSIDLARKILDFKPTIDFEDGLNKTIDYYIRGME